MEAKRRGIDLTHLDLRNDPIAADLYEKPFALIRPDQIVAWRGDAPDASAVEAIFDQVLGGAAAESPRRVDALELANLGADGASSMVVNWAAIINTPSASPVTMMIATRGARNGLPTNHRFSSFRPAREHRTDTGDNQHDPDNKVMHVVSSSISVAPATCYKARC